ncbi:MAG TPA: HAD family acid phosphatase [Nocardioides sp.]|jgi:hypothetical protein|nr:HAD family acid phosphatase [Nocardioides sp.]
MSTFLNRLARAALVALLVASVAAPAHAASRLPSEKHWRKDVSRAMSGSRGYLRDVVAVGGGPFAINLDIDNTSLATHYRPGSPVLAVRAFARFAHQHDIAVMFNTGRLQSHLKSARTQLRKAGFPITEMCGRSSRSETLDQSKPRCREQFVSEGYTIIANVGNNPTDFSGVDDYGRAFRLPNYGGRLG